MNHDDVKILARESLYEGFFRAERIKLQFKLFAGDWSETVEREVFIRPSAVGILLYDPEIDQVVLIEQFRPGALNHPETPWMLELAAGIIEPNETPQDVAIRESMEETGCEILELIPISHYWSSAGGCNEQMILFCGKINAKNAGGIYGQKAEHEDIKVHTFSSIDAINLVKQNKISNAAAIIALQWLELNIDKVKHGKK